METYIDSYRVKKQIITTKYYKPYAKKYDYIEKANKENFLKQFLNDAYFIKFYKKLNTIQKKEVRKYRKQHNLESVYNKVKLQCR